MSMLCVDWFKGVRGVGRCTLIMAALQTRQIIASRENKILKKVSAGKKLIKKNAKIVNALCDFSFKCSKNKRIIKIVH